MAKVSQGDGFYPALARIKMVGATAIPTTETSGILGSVFGKYKSIKGRSGSIPFGRTLTSVIDTKTGAAETSLADVDEEDVTTDLLNSLNLARQKLEVIEEKIDFINTYGNQ